MGLIQRTLPALFNGVSRQPAILRSSDQTESELNSWTSLSAGVGKRPPTEHIAKLFDTLPAGTFVHAINRDSTERYFVIVSAGSIRVFDFDGDEKTVNAPGGLTYLTGSDYAAVTVADYTFIVNRGQAVAMKDAGEDTVAPPAYLRYPSSFPEKFNWAGVEGYDDVFSGAEVQYTPNPVLPALTGTVSSMEDLPDPPTGLYRISGNSGAGFLSYYVKADGDTWAESVAPDLKNALDEATMPHCLIREGDGTFTFAPFSWAPRRVGDDSTNPAPTFVNRRIRDVAFYQNRLVFLVDESVVMSCAGDFGNYWRTTVLDLIDSDPVDVAVTTTNVAILDFITLFNDGALLFADQTQFSLSNAENGVTPASVAIRPVTRYPLSRKARPVVVGTEVYFAGDNAGYSVLYEYTRQADSDTTIAAEITAHVPGLIPSDIQQLVAIPRGILALTGGGSVFCYQFFWNGNEKLISAWRPWSMNGNIIAATNIGSVVFFVVERDTGVFLERMELADGYTAETQDWSVHLDRQFNMAGVEADGGTTFNLPYDVPEDERADFLIVGGNDGDFSYSPFDPTTYSWTDANTVVVPMVDLGTACAGTRMDFHIEPSRQFQVTPQGVPVTTGRLLLRAFTLNYTNTAGFMVEVWPYGRARHPDLEASYPKKILQFTGKTLGTGTSVLGQQSVVDGSYTFTVTGDASLAIIRVSDRSHGRATFSSAEWEGFYNRRS